MNKKPSNVKKLQGTFRKDRAPRQEPLPPSGKPACPAHITGVGRQVWDDLCNHLENMGVLTQADGTALELIVDAYVVYRQAQAVISAHGIVYETTTATGDKMQRPRPEVAVASDCWRRIHKMLIEFGLTPASRTKVEASIPEHDPLLELLNRR